MENILIMAILMIVVGAAVSYIWKAKKSGKKCIGCPNSGCTSCHCKNDSL